MLNPADPTHVCPFCCAEWRRFSQRVEERAQWMNSKNYLGAPNAPEGINSVSDTITEGEL